MPVAVKAASRIPAILASVDNARRAAVTEGVIKMSSVSQDKVAVDTGALKQSKEQEIRDGANTTRGVVSYNTHYAIYVEMGTSKMAAQPYLVPGHSAGKAAMLRSLAMWLDRA